MSAKGKLLLELAKKANKDNSLPLKETTTSLVFGEGNTNSKIYFLGAARCLKNLKRILGI